MRLTRMVALGASLLVLVSACATGGGASPSPAATGTPATTEAPAATGTPATTGGAGSPAGATIASQLVLGGPPECPERPFCLIGLQETYGLEFAEFRPLDAGGPLTVAAIENGDIDVGLLFTSDPAIADKGFVLLEDDKQLQLADNIIPVIRQEVLDESPEIADLINPWMAKLTQEELTALNAQVNVEQEDPADAVAAWLEENGLAEGDAGAGTTVVVGSTDFYEQEVLGEIFGQVLEANGFTVERQFQLGNREVVFPALESGEIDMLAEYIATALEFVNEGAGEATTDPAETADVFNERIEPLGLIALDYAPATDQNGFVVTQATADQYGLTRMSDLAKPAP